MELIYEYGLSFDYVASETFGDEQVEPYWRYQLSWGGPADEFRIFSDGHNLKPYRIEYHFIDWMDGARRTLGGDDLELLLEYWSWFQERGLTDQVSKEALANRSK